MSGPVCALSPCPGRRSTASATPLTRSSRPTGPTPSQTARSATASMIRAAPRRPDKRALSGTPLCLSGGGRVWRDRRPVPAQPQAARRTADQRDREQRQQRGQRMRPHGMPADARDARAIAPGHGARSCEIQGNRTPHDIEGEGPGRRPGPSPSISCGMVTAPRGGGVHRSARRALRPMRPRRGAEHCHVSLASYALFHDRPS